MGNQIDEKENTCIWEQIKMGDWFLYRTGCGSAKYTKDKDWSSTKCGACGGTVILEPKS